MSDNHGSDERVAVQPHNDEVASFRSAAAAAGIESVQITHD